MAGSERESDGASEPNAHDIHRKGCIQTEFTGGRHGAQQLSQAVRIEIIGKDGVIGVFGEGLSRVIPH